MGDNSYMKKKKLGYLFLMGKKHMKIQDPCTQLPLDVGGIKKDGQKECNMPLKLFKVGGTINPKQNMST